MSHEGHGMTYAFGDTALTPVIRTARLTLRGHRAADLEDAASMWADPAVTRFIGGRPSTEQQTWSRMLGYAGHWALLRFGYWALEDNASGSFVGELGFADFRRDIAPSMRNAPELGWALATAFRGRGYATEALRAAVAWGDVRFDAARTVCLIDPSNHASVRVAEKCGYVVFERAEFNGQPTLFLERPGPP